MRDIKFRGKRIDNGEWVYGCLVVNPYETAICDESDVTFSRVEVDPDTVGQITGLKDKNGKEIFDGDVVQMYAYKGRVGEVVFGKYITENQDNEDILGWCIETSERYYALDPQSTYEVIGNVWENVDLLK